MENNWELLNKKVVPETWSRQVGRYGVIHTDDLRGPIGSLVLRGELSAFPVFIFDPKDVEQREQADTRKRIADRIERENNVAVLPA